jgi:hypothetical protein
MPARCPVCPKADTAGRCGPHLASRATAPSLALSPRIYRRVREQPWACGHTIGRTAGTGAHTSCFASSGELAQFLCCGMRHSSQRWNWHYATLNGWNCRARASVRARSIKWPVIGSFSSLIRRSASSKCLITLRRLEASSSTAGFAFFLVIDLTSGSITESDRLSST